MLRHACAAVLALLIALPACGGGTDRINGSVTVEDGQKADDVSTINGSVRIGANATVDEATTVNGSIHVADNATARSLTTVNGAIRVGKGTRVSGDVSTVNGSLNLEEGTQISGNLTNVNGRIQLEKAQVSGSVKTVNGSVYVGRDSHIVGGLRIERPQGFNMDWGKRDVPIVVIGPGATVDGPMEFEREVKLYVSDSARIGKVSGATPIKFSGERPQEI